ncbi:hypothetical protein [Sinomicrobium weinanense]|uniref:Uncharacterized protein n=1 Tax=Sinomicrobium weinanense TaxID=2842200 RepID=A0A926JP51_9FLAO|nr:hypothetical protein [Sinomicrobium weinanense]MBC9794733.1 hypothetical protein [Sinomicrobium weinanense]MBU3124992.1 hypothetical protein [Sinomicrobium weinanense]
MMIYQDPHREEQIRKAIKAGGGEKPSPDFVRDVMQQVAKEQELKEVYKPLISRTAWGVISVMVACVISLSLFAPEKSWTLDLSFLSFLKTSTSPFLWYCIGIISLLVLVQVPLLKIYHSRSISRI